jgi:hypothetical protein
MAEEKKIPVKEPEEINEDIDLEKAQAEAAEDDADMFVFKFKTPFEYEGKTYNELKFDFNGLTGADSINIEAELQAKGVAIFAPAFSAPYLVRMCARACTEKVDYRFFEAMKLKDYVTIRSKARNFLLSSES